MSSCQCCGGTGTRAFINVDTGEKTPEFCPCKGLPCPFCGAATSNKTLYQTSILTFHAEAIGLRNLTKGIHPENVEYALECGECKSNGPLAPSKEAAVEAWNKRKVPAHEGV